MQVGEQRAGATDGQRRVIDAKAGQRRHGKVLLQQSRATVAAEVVAGAVGDRGFRLRQPGLVLVAPVFGQQQLGWFDARQFVGQSVVRDFGHEERAGRQLDPSNAAALLAERYRRKVVATAPVEQGVFGQRAGRDDANDGALDNALRFFGVLDLFADGDAMADLHQAAQVAIERANRHAGHRNRGFALAARGQRDAERLRRHLGVVMEQLVEVAHAEEHDRIGGLFFGRCELAHRRSLGLAHRRSSPLVVLAG